MSLFFYKMLVSAKNIAVGLEMTSLCKEDSKCKEIERFCRTNNLFYDVVDADMYVLVSSIKYMFYKVSPLSTSETHTFPLRGIILNKLEIELKLIIADL